MTLRPFYAAVLTATLLLSALGCGEDPATQIVLIVDTDLSIPADADTIQLVATGPSGMNETPPPRTLTGAAGELPLILTLSPAGSELGPINLTIAATRGGSPVVSRQVRTSFIKGKGKTLFVFLRSACGLRACSGDQSCGNEGTCVPLLVDAATLPDFTGTPPTDLDAGVVACTPSDPPVESCNGNDDDCNGTPDDGDLCPTMSGAPTMGASCMSGACVNACAAGTGDCDALYPNGCETDTNNTPSHCGTCGNVCDSGACVAGACVGGGFQTSFGTTGTTGTSETLVGMAIDPSGNLFVTGSFEAPLDIRGMVYTPLGRSVYLAKYSPAGEFIDAKSLGGTGTDTAVDLGVDSDGNITLLMNFTGTAAFGSDTLDAGAAPSQNVALVRFDNDLGYLGSRPFGSVGVDQGYAMDVMGDGSVTLAAFANGPVNFMGTSIVDGFFVARFRVNSTGGLDKVWTKSFGDGLGTHHTISAVTTDSSGNAYLAGHHLAGLSLDGRRTMGEGSFTFRLDATDGGVRWVQDYAGMTGEARRVAADGDDLLVLGDFTGSFNLAGPAAPGNLTASSPTRDGFIGKLAGATGELVWQRSIGSSRQVDAVGVAMEEPTRVVGVLGFEASAMLLGKSALGIGGRDALAFHVTEDSAGTNIDSGALPGLRPIGSAGRERVQIMAHRGGRICIGGMFDAAAPIDLLAAPDGTPYVPLGSPSMIVSSGADDIFLACFSSGAIHLGGI